MLLNKGRELLARNSYQKNQRSDRNQQKLNLDKIQQNWEKLRRDVSDRHTRLQTCMVSFGAIEFYCIIIDLCIIGIWNSFF